MDLGVPRRAPLSLAVASLRCGVLSSEWWFWLESRWTAMPKRHHHTGLETQDAREERGQSGRSETEAVEEVRALLPIPFHGHPEIEMDLAAEKPLELEPGFGSGIPEQGATLPDDDALL